MTESQNGLVQILRRARNLVPFLFLFLVQANAQLEPFTSLFKDFNGVVGWYAVGLSDPRTINTPKGFNIPHGFENLGFELLLGPYPAPEKNSLRDSLQIVQKMIQKKLLITRRIDADEQQTLVNIEHAIDSMKADDSKENAGSWRADIGVGFDFSNKYSLNSDSLEIRNSIRGYYIGAYLEFPEKVICERVSYYVGATGGFYDLSHSTAYGPPNTELELKASTFGFEVVVAGLAIEIVENNPMIIELSYKNLVFEGVRYSKIEGSFPVGLPQSFDLSGWRLSVGLQLAKGN